MSKSIYQNLIGMSAYQLAEAGPDYIFSGVLENVDGEQMNWSSNTSSFTLGSASSDPKALRVVSVRFFGKVERPKAPTKKVKRKPAGKGGVGASLDTPYIFSPQDGNCLRDCFIYTYPSLEAEFTAYCKKNRSSGARKITSMNKKFQTNMGWLVPQNVKGFHYIRPNKPNCDAYMAIVDQVGNLCADHSGHWIIVKELRQPSEMGKCIKTWFNIKQQLDKTALLTTDVKQRTLKPEECRSHKLIAYDLETYGDKDKIAVPYAMGWQPVEITNRKFNFEECLKLTASHEPEIVDGEGCISKALNQIANKYAYLVNLRKAPTKIFMFAHNGAKFDLYVLLQENLQGFRPEKIINTPGGIISLNLIHDNGLVFVFRDTCKHILSSLDRICKDFKFSEEFAKGKIDHTLVTKETWNTPEQRAKWMPYLKLDVKALARIIVYINQMYVTAGINHNTEAGPAGRTYYVCRPPVTWFMTAPSAAWEYVLQNGFESQKMTNAQMRAWMKGAVIGGRVQACIKDFTHPGFEDILAANEAGNLKEAALIYQGYKNKGIYGLTAFDANSLYPSAMCETLHTTTPYLPALTNPQALVESKDLVFMEFEHIYPPKDLFVPLLPFKNSDGALVWGLEPIHNQVFTNIDLQEAQKKGYTFENLLFAVGFSGTNDALPATMKHIYAQRNVAKAEGNKILGDAYKLIMNAVYGKMVMKDIPTQHQFTNKPMDEDKTEGGYTYTMNNTDWYLYKTRKLDNSPYIMGGPHHVGAEILSKSKRIMNRAIEAIDGFRTPQIYYMDTDSMYASEKHIPTLEAAGLIGPNCGQFKNDYGDETIIHARFICSKVKLCVTMNTKTGKISFHPTFKGFRFTATTPQEAMEVFANFEKGNLENTAVMFKKSLETGVKIEDVKKEYSKPNNKRQPARTIWVNHIKYKTVMAPFGYDEDWVREEEPVAAQPQPIIEDPGPTAAEVTEIINHNDFVILTGGPGTGKTTLVKGLTGIDYPILAPTRLAASNYPTAKTIHSFLFKLNKCFGFTNDLGQQFYSSEPIRHNEAKCDAYCELNHTVCECEPLCKPLSLAGCGKIIIDEFSMVDRELLLTADALVLVGDLNQLPPVQGHPLNEEDLAKFKIIKLTKNYRATNPKLFEAALEDPIRCLKSLPRINKDFALDNHIPILTWRRDTAQEYEENRPFGLYRKTDTDNTSFMVIVSKKSYVGGLTGKCIYQTDMGEVVTYSKVKIRKAVAAKKLTRIEARKLFLFPTMVKCGAMTTHKSQGQTFDKVAVCQRDMIQFANTKFWNPKLVYTAITRGRESYRV